MGSGELGVEMIFAEMPLDEAEGAILGYATTAGALTLRKGTVLDALNLALLREAGVGSVLAARLEQGDIGEDEAALAIARLIASADVETGNATTGRVNLHARKNGIFWQMQTASMPSTHMMRAFPSRRCATMCGWKPVR